MTNHVVNIKDFFKKMGHSRQCGQMARLLLLYLAMYNNEPMPNSKNVPK